MDLLTWFTEVGLPEPHTVTVEAYLGSSGRGDQYGPGVSVTCFVDAKRRLVRAPNGSQVVSSSTVFAPLDTDCPARSRVTLPDGHTALVIGTARREAGGIDEAPEHLEITLE